MIRFLDSARFMKDSPNNLVNNLSGGIYKRTDCKNFEEVKDSTVEWCGEYKDCKKLSDNRKKCYKIHEDCKCYLE